jgi:hypothetical protein
VALTTKENQLLTQTSAGTPMGELLRRYWWTIAAVDQLTTTRTKAVHLLGEGLPVVGRATFAEPRTLAAFYERHTRLAQMGFPSAYPFQAGQPERVRAEYARALGIT